MSFTWYVDPTSGTDSVTTYPLGWYSAVWTGGTGSEPPTDGTQTATVREDDWNWGTIGAPVFLDTATAGGMTLTKLDDVVRIVGYVRTADEIFFKPSNDYITVV